MKDASFLFPCYRVGTHIALAGSISLKVLEIFRNISFFVSLLLYASLSRSRERKSSWLVPSVLGKDWGMAEGEKVVTCHKKHNSSGLQT